MHYRPWISGNKLKMDADYSNNLDCDPTAARKDYFFHHLSFTSPQLCYRIRLSLSTAWTEHLCWISLPFFVLSTAATVSNARFVGIRHVENVGSRLDHCNSLPTGINNNLIKEIQLAQFDWSPTMRSSNTLWRCCATFAVRQRTFSLRTPLASVNSSR